MRTLLVWYRQGKSGVLEEKTYLSTNFPHHRSHVDWLAWDPLCVGFLVGTVAGIRLLFCIPYHHFFFSQSRRGHGTVISQWVYCLRIDPLTDRGSEDTDRCSSWLYPVLEKNAGIVPGLIPWPLTDISFPIYNWLSSNHEMLYSLNQSYPHLVK